MGQKVKGGIRLFYPSSLSPLPPDKKEGVIIPMLTAPPLQVKNFKKIP
jgi:hypothetical protein